MLDCRIQDDMIIYAYSGPTDGTYYIEDRKYYVGQDFRTESEFKKYLKAGLNTLLIQGNDPYCGENFDTSSLKRNMDMALNAGIKRVIVFDKRIFDITESQEPVLGKDLRFTDENELDNFISDCMKDYVKHPAFYGVMLCDEPLYQQFPAIGAVMKSLKRVKPDIFIQLNLLPLMSGSHYRFKKDGKPSELIDCYKNYLDEYLKQTSAKSLLTDCYGLCTKERADYVGSVLKENLPGYENIKCNSSIYPLHIRSVQIAADFCRDNGIEFQNIAQSFAMDVRGELGYRKPSEDDVKWQINLLLGFGVRQIAYFTYWRKQMNSKLTEFFPDGTAMVTSNGKATSVYFAVKRMNRIAQKMYPTLKVFSYRCANYYVPPETEMPDYFIGLEKSNFEKLNSFYADGPLLITELKSNSGKFMYMAFHAGDPVFGKNRINIFLEIKGEKGTLIKKGKKHFVKIKNGKYKTKLCSGDAVFLIVE